MSEAGDGDLRPEHLRYLFSLVAGSVVPDGFVERFPLELRPAVAAMAAANGRGRLDLLQEFRPDLVEPVLRAGAGAEVKQPSGGYPVEALPMVLQTLVTEGAAATSTKPEMVALPLLAVCAGVLGNTAYLHYRDSWREYASIWCAVVSGPGTGKTPAQKVARLALEPLIDAAHARYDDEKRQYDAELAVWQGTRARDRHSPQPAEPVRTRYLAVDATLEALKRVLAQNPGIVMPFDELSLWVKSFDAYRGGRGGDRANWLGLWSGANITVDRAGQEYISVAHPVVAVCGGIQPSRLADLSAEAHTADGFLERFLWACPPDEIAHLSNAELSPGTVPAVTRMLRTLRHRVTPGTAVVVLDRGARRAFAEWHAANVERMAKVRGIIRSVYAKLPGQLLKLALILHCVEQAENPAGAVVDADLIQRTVLLIEYHRLHAHLALGLFGAEPEKSEDVRKQPLPDGDELLAERLYRALGRKVEPGGEIAAREVVWALPHASRGDAGARERARDLLEQDGRIVVRWERQARGPARELWRLVVPLLAE